MCTFAWQEIPLNSRTVLNWPRTRVASLMPNPDITVFVGRRRGVGLKDLKSASDKMLMVAPESIHWTFDGYRQKIGWCKEGFLLYLYGIHIPCHCRCLSLVGDPECSSLVADWFGFVGGLFSIVYPCLLLETDGDEMSPSLAIGTLVLECREGCRSPFMWVFPIAISAQVLLEMFACPLMFISDFDN